MPNPNLPDLGQRSAYALAVPFQVESALKEFEDESINLLHIDGSHDYENVSGHFESWLPKIKRNGVILIHDINVKREDFGVEKFWEELKSKYFTKTHEEGHGLGIVLIGTSTVLLLH